MIFLTVGTQLPFDRLIQCVDELCKNNPDLEVFGQIGHCEYKPKYFKYNDTLSIQEFNKLFLSADYVISHAGMGSILTALSNNKPILMMPREAKFNEHRNDHQLGTAKNFSEKNGCYVFNNLQELEKHYNNLLETESVVSKVNKYAPELTLSNLKAIVNSN
ncbi:glycosyltransferase [Colwellia sp. UCD-KL20]|uniref:glycosyltransferase n=1 Tax=Colwellia sp. UCD-KL20 TaxID=1917165 RepID=UPI000970CDD0|nr:glycosyltransferase [Colwellia sp. UCD-KL20]